MPGDNILGEIIPGKQIIVHRRECNKILELISSNKNSVIRLSWPKIKQDKYKTKIIIEADGRANIGTKLTKEILEHGNIKILAIKFDNENSHSIIIMTLTVNNKKSLSELIKKYKKFDGVISVERFME